MQKKTRTGLIEGRRPRSRGVSQLSILLIAIVVIAGFSAFAYFTLQPQPQKFKVGGLSTTFGSNDLVVNAGNEQSIWAKNGLDPEFVTIPRPSLVPADIKEQVASGVKIGFDTTVDVFSARADGVPVKVAAGYTGGPTALKMFSKPDSPIKTAQDLDGKKVGVISMTHNTARIVIYLSQRFTIKPELVPLGNLTNNLAALKAGRIDAFSSSDAAAYMLVDSGELKIVVPSGDFVPKPWSALDIWATDDLIQQNPDLVQRFVKAWLQLVLYLNNNPVYTSGLYTRNTGVSKDLADKTVSLLAWTPNGRGSGQDLVVALRTHWEFAKSVGGVPAQALSWMGIEEAVDTRFLQ